MELVEHALADNSNPRNAMTIVEIMELPAAERQKIFEEQARDAAQYYKNDPDLIFNANDDILEY